MTSKHYIDRWVVLSRIYSPFQNILMFMANVLVETHYKDGSFCSQKLADTTFFRHLNDI